MHRRGLLALGVVSAAVLALGGGAVALLEPGLRAGRLSTRAREVFAGVARALLDGTLPREPAAAQREIAALLERLDALVTGLPPHVQSELSQLLALLGTTAGRLALAGLREDWAGASVAQVSSALQAMRASGIALRRQSYQAFHELVMAAYFSEPATWQALGYPGPVKLA